jgi:hypothetical protein
MEELSEVPAVKDRMPTVKILALVGAVTATLIGIFLWRIC